MEKSIVAKFALLVVVIFLTSCASATRQSHYTQTSNTQETIWQPDAKKTWANLLRNSSAKLLALKNSETDTDKVEWLSLAINSKRLSKNPSELAHYLITWQADHPTHVANAILPSKTTLESMASVTPPKQIAVLLPETGKYAASGRIIREGFLNAYYVNNPTAISQRVKFYDTAQGDIKSVYDQAIADGADFIVGPLIKDHVRDLNKHVSFNYPTLALNYLEETHTKKSPNYFEFGLLPEDEAVQIAEKARFAGHGKAIIVAPNNAWGKRVVSAFNLQWQKQGGTIQDTWYFNLEATFNDDIARLLKITPAEQSSEGDQNGVITPHRRQDFDVVFLFAPPQQARVIVPLIRYHYASRVPIYASSAIHAGKTKLTADIDLNGVIVCDIPKSQVTALQKLNGDKRLYAVGQDAYLLTQTLPRLTALPEFPIYGATGALTVSENHQIHRRLPCTTIQNNDVT